MRAALLRNDRLALKAVLATLDRPIRSRHERLEERERRCRELGDLLALPAGSVRLNQVLTRLPADAARPLLAVSGRLRRLAEQIDALNQHNRLLVHQLLDLVNDQLLHITGGEPAGTGYGRSGTPGPAVYGSLIRRRG